jgi:MFS family permease
MMLRKFRSAAGTYPSQFWLLFWGLLISTIGASMIWPFLMIYVSSRLKLPLTTVASLMTINAVVGLAFAFIAGSITDRFGRKWVMAISLAGNAVGYLLMSQASTLPQFAILMGLTGMFTPLYRVGADAMMADLVPMEKRVDAYSLLRMSNNIGVSLGPAIGGFLAASSYSVAFLCASAGMMAYSLLVFFRARETLPSRAAAGPAAPRENLAGYGRVFRDRQYLAFIFSMTLIQISAALVWVLLGVYAKQNYGVHENQYGLIPTTNAVMVVLFQVLVTRVTKRYTPLVIMAIGSLCYAIGTGSVAFGQGFWGFWLSMVIITIGELILVPTSSTYAANMAPAEMRGRYLSLYGLTWSLASGIGPVLGGVLNDQIRPQAIWYGGFIVGMCAVAGFLLLNRRFPSTAVPEDGPNPESGPA